MLSRYKCIVGLLSNFRGELIKLPQTGPVASHRHHFGLFAVSEHLIEAWFASFRNQKLTFPSRKVRHSVLNVDTLGIPTVHVVDNEEHLLLATTLSARSEVMIIANNFAHYRISKSEKKTGSTILNSRSAKAMLPTWDRLAGLSIHTLAGYCSPPDGRA